MVSHNVVYVSVTNSYNITNKSYSFTTNTIVLLHQVFIEIIFVPKTQNS